MQKLTGELYERLYGFAGEDFVNHKDMLQRDMNLNAHVIALHAALNVQSALLAAHAHISAEPGKPTSPPMTPVSISLPGVPGMYTNTTGLQTNLLNSSSGRYMLSYWDSRIGATNLNQPIMIKRRMLPTLINQTVVTPPLVRQ